MAEPAPVGGRASQPKSARMDLRLSVEQKMLFEEAAALLSRSTTDFVVASAEVAARNLLADRTQFVLGQQQWDAFAAALDREPRYLPELASFLAAPSVLEQE
jgi:uncharacterized protein (DUF1778 family)